MAKRATKAPVRRDPPTDEEREERVRLLVPHGRPATRKPSVPRRPTRKHR